MPLPGHDECSGNSKLSIVVMTKVSKDSCEFPIPKLYNTDFFFILNYHFVECHDIVRYHFLGLKNQNISSSLKIHAPFNYINLKAAYCRVVQQIARS